MEKLLFICNQNENRSKTAEVLFKNKYITKSAGLFNEKPLTEKQINWADIVLVMEESQRNEIAKRFPKSYIKKQILCLDIPDIYRFNQPKLVSILKKKVNKVFTLLTIH